MDAATAAANASSDDGILCAIANNYAENTFSNFLASWAAITVIATVALVGMSGGLFYSYYVHPTYEKWVNKSNPAFPAPLKVKEEITQMCKGLLIATLCPTLSLWLAANGHSKAFCGWHDREGNYYSLGAQIGMFFGIWLASDFVEFFYHYLGHRYHFFWMQHKFHHRFGNPT